MHFSDLKTKTVLITGASSGLGKHFAECLAAVGARIIITARRFDKLESLADKLGNALAIKMDVTDENSIRNAFEDFEQRGERIDVCINNAGVAKWTPLFLDELGNYDAFEKGAIKIWDEVMAVNLRGTWLVTQFAATHMKKHTLAGSIINIASNLGDMRPLSGASASCLSKAGIIHMTKQLVPELSKYNIRINCLVPGIFWSELTQAQLTKREKEIKDKIPLQFIGQVSDFDQAMLYFASNKASGYVTGSCLTLDGGASWGQ